MSEENVPNEAENPPRATEAQDAPESPATAAEREDAKKVFLVPYPKIVFLYPTFITSVICWLIMLGSSGESTRTHEVTSLVFLGIFALNLVVVTFDFPRTTSLTLFFFIGMLIMALFVLGKYELLPFEAMEEMLAHLKPVANAWFYGIFAGILLLFYLGVLVAVQFDYWEVRSNELLHHHGILSDLKRFPAPNLRVDKEINDVFEYMLLRSGRLILHARSESRAIVLDNVLFINTKEERLTKMLGAVQVSVRDDD